jgi:excisionase family DNA binding protein
VARVAAVLPGYASVARAAEVLHLAPRTVRDLIYAGRLPSVRIGRLHYVRASDLEAERRRRLGLPLPSRRTPRRRPPPEAATAPRASHERPHVDPAVRRQRAAERAEIVRRWAQRHAPAGPRVPFAPIEISEPGLCASCGRQLRQGARAVDALEANQRLCVTCGRRALMDWADRRRLEAAAARRLAQELPATADRPAQVA